MKSWIVYNGALNVGAISGSQMRIIDAASKMGIEMEAVKNNEIICFIGRGGELEIRSIGKRPIPDFVIFWDKDVELAKALKKAGMKVYNSPEAIEICDDKAKTHLQLSKCGIKMPETVIGPFVFFEQQLSDVYLEELMSVLGETLVIKEAKGSFGEQVYLEKGKDAIRKRVLSLGSKTFIFQKFIESSRGKDVRVNIIGDKILGAMLRKNENDFRANISIGGTGEKYELSKEEKEIAMKVHKLLKLDFSGVDLLFGDDGAIFCEINSNANFLGFEKATGVDYARELVEYLCKKAQKDIK